MCHQNTTQERVSNNVIQCTHLVRNTGHITVPVKLQMLPVLLPKRTDTAQSIQCNTMRESVIPNDIRWNIHHNYRNSIRSDKHTHHARFSHRQRQIIIIIRPGNNFPTSRPTTSKVSSPASDRSYSDSPSRVGWKFSSSVH